MDLDYWSISSLSHELKERLSEARPVTFGAAQRVDGVTPAGLFALYTHIKLQNKRKSVRGPLIPAAEAGLDDADLPVAVPA